MGHDIIMPKCPASLQARGCREDLIVLMLVQPLGTHCICGRWMTGLSRLRLCSSSLALSIIAMVRRQNLPAQVKIQQLRFSSPAFAARQNSFQMPVAQMAGRLPLPLVR